MSMIPEQREDYLMQLADRDAMLARKAKENKEVQQSEKFKFNQLGDSNIGNDQEVNLSIQYLLSRIDDFQLALSDIQLPTPTKDGEVVEVGSYVTYVDYPVSKDSTGVVTEEEPQILEALVVEGEMSHEARHNSDISFILDNAPLGKVLIGSKVDDVVSFTLKSRKTGKEVIHKCLVIDVDNNYIYQRYATEYQSLGK